MNVKLWHAMGMHERTCTLTIYCINYQWSIIVVRMNDTQPSFVGASTALPVLLFESSGSHHLADWLGILAAARDNDHRVCVWDKPGLGFSDHLFGYQTNAEEFVPLIIKKLIDLEPNYGPPYALAG